MNNKSNSGDNRRSEENRRTEDQGQAKLVAKLQAEVAALRAELAAVPEVAPAGDDALRGLASTYVAALRNGHPDATKHLATLLTALGS
tara:strand:+ start:746 stop:1009 length:264 start_codon:yes stop_codon:yes gene_type:complete